MGWKQVAHILYIFLIKFFANLNSTPHVHIYKCFSYFTSALLVPWGPEGRKGEGGISSVQHQQTQNCLWDTSLDF